MDWNALEAFLLVAETGSLSEAAKHSDTSVATIGRKVDRLEALFDGPLLVRGKTGTALTPLGLSLLEETSGMQSQFDRLNEFVSRQRQAGSHELVRISATEPIISDYLAPRLAQVQSHARVDLISEASVSNLNRVEADLAVRMFRPKEPNLKARQIGRIALGWFASVDYLGTRAPEDIDLNTELLLAISTAFGDIPEVNWVRHHGLAGNVVCQSTSSRALLRGAQAGAGIALGSREMALKMGLVEVKAPPVPDREIWLTSHHSSLTSPRLLTVKDWIIRSFKDGPIAG